MPIYAYKCESCGHAKDVLQKMSDPVLTQCPACGQATFKKQLTAAGFQLKGSGWYVTDFREGSKAKEGKDGKESSSNGTSAAPATAGSNGDNKTDNKSSAETSAVAAPASAPAPAPVSANTPTSSP